MNNEKIDKHGFTQLDIIEIVENGGLENWTEKEQSYIKQEYNKLPLSKQQRQQLKTPCPVCQAKTSQVGDLADFDHDIIMCENPACRFALMFDGYRVDLDI